MSGAVEVKETIEEYITRRYFEEVEKMILKAWEEEDRILMYADGSAGPKGVIRAAH